MSRSGYTEELSDIWALIRWRGVVASSIKGKRGQTFLKELVAALDAMPVKRLIAHDLRKEGEVCAIGAVGAQRGLKLEHLDPEDYTSIASTFGIAAPLVQEIEYMNDEGVYCKSAEERWAKMRAWTVSKLLKDPSHD
jgi:hypothetical protein